MEETVSPLRDPSGAVYWLVFGSWRRGGRAERDERDERQDVVRVQPDGCVHAAIADHVSRFSAWGLLLFAWGLVMAAEDIVGLRKIDHDAAGHVMGYLLIVCIGMAIWHIAFTAFAGVLWISGREAFAERIRGVLFPGVRDWVPLLVLIGVACLSA